MTQETKIFSHLCRIHSDEKGVKEKTISLCLPYLLDFRKWLTVVVMSCVVVQIILKQLKCNIQAKVQVKKVVLNFI